ncbi:1-acyl-sn-glycerol-3-phosphate acyltransferase [Candidatus Saccharibacteria bacterium]|nr:1-acyl-sn-glycerol-3-phosphate acyltransferase [Candidatus Saccharibacteria bacterium]MCL1963048.1 1-acyl-sn-glycerol-3-phosphate acyltransferase [Candidatus Saccharibacteria bacterium]
MIPRFISSSTYYTLYFFAKRSVWRKMKITEHGKKNIPRKGAVIFAANHIKDLDSVMICGAARRPTHFFAKKVLFMGGKKLSLKAVTMIMKMTGQIPVKPGDKELNDRAFAMAETFLKRGEAFAIHIEGTRTNDGKLHKPKLGFTKVAFNTHAPIVPVALTYNRHPSVHFDKPIPYDEYKDWDAEFLGDEVTRRIAKMSGQEISPEFSELINKGDTVVLESLIKKGGKPS